MHHAATDFAPAENWIHFKTLLNLNIYLEIHYHEERERERELNKLNRKGFSKTIKRFICEDYSPNALK